MTEPAATKPPSLSGPRVLDLTGELGALAPRLLAGLGADVLRVEPPGGHPTRRRGPFVAGTPHPDRSLSWFQMNAGKRSVTLNLESADGRALFLKLVAGADVVIESLPVGALDRLGLSHDALHRANPALVRTSVSAYGQTGPLAAAPATDLTLLAAGGLMYLNGDPDRPPVRAGADQAYAQAGLHAAVATLIGWVRRKRTGLGAHLDVSAQECVTWTLANNRLLTSASGAITHRIGGGRAGGAGERLLYKAADGYVAFFRRPESHVGLQSWLDDVGVEVSFNVAALQGVPTRGEGQADRSQVAELEGKLAAYFASRPARVLEREGQRRGLYIAAALSARDILEGDHLQTRGFWQRLEHPELGMTITYPGAPFQAPASPWRVERRAPLPGEHNAEVYMGELGLTRAGLVHLRAVGAI